MLTLLNPALAQDVLERLPRERRQKVITAAPAATRQQWMRNERYPEHSIRSAGLQGLELWHDRSGP